MGLVGVDVVVAWCGVGLGGSAGVVPWAVLGVVLEATAKRLAPRTARMRAPSRRCVDRLELLRSRSVDPRTDNSRGTRSIPPNRTLATRLKAGRIGRPSRGHSPVAVAITRERSRPWTRSRLLLCLVKRQRGPVMLWASAWSAAGVLPRLGRRTLAHSSARGVDPTGCLSTWRAVVSADQLR